MKVFYFCLIILFCLSVSCTQSNKSSGFIKVRNTRFVLDNKPYYFLGTNLWYGCYLGKPDNSNGRERLKRELNRLSAIGITNLRLIGGSEESSIKNSLKPAFQVSKGTYNRDLLEGLDFLLAEMKKRNMHAVIFLNNYWEWSGGMLQYISWEENRPPDDPASGIEWNELMTRVTKFYANAGANTLFKNYVKMLISRKNVFTGCKYLDDNTIMAWELANEPRGGEGKNGPLMKEVFCQWVDETADFIHSIDSNHLVTTGSEGIIGCKGDAELYKKSNNSKSIDYLTFHLWPYNWDWFKPDGAAITFQRSIDKSVIYIKDHIHIARQLNKPLVMEEFGFRRDSLKYSAGSSTILRDKFYKVVLKLAGDSIGQNAPFGGINFWGWSGEGRPKHPGGNWQPGDDYVIEPPFEAQGVNSVYDNDSGTIKLLRIFASKIEKTIKEDQ